MSAELSWRSLCCRRALFTSFWSCCLARSLAALTRVGTPLRLTRTHGLPPSHSCGYSNTDERAIRNVVVSKECRARSAFTHRLMTRMQKGCDKHGCEAALVVGCMDGITWTGLCASAPLDSSARLLALDVGLYFFLSWRRSREAQANVAAKRMPTLERGLKLCLEGLKTPPLSSGENHPPVWRSKPAACGRTRVALSRELKGGPLVTTGCAKWGAPNFCSPCPLRKVIFILRAVPARSSRAAGDGSLAELGEVGIPEGATI